MYKWGLSFLVAINVILTGCERTPQQHSDQSFIKDDSSALATRPIKVFPQTEQDQSDIARLSDFDHRFYSVSEEMEKELEQMEKAGTLTEEFSHQRRTDNVNSALNMLKELKLDTEQGRYIQGLFVTYWEKQAALLNSKEGAVPTPRQTLQDLSIYLHAQEQLDQWQAQYTHLLEDQAHTDAKQHSASEPSSDTAVN